MQTLHHSFATLTRSIVTVLASLALTCAHAQSNFARQAGRASAPVAAKWGDPNAGVTLTTTGSGPAQPSGKGAFPSMTRLHPVQPTKPCVPQNIKIKDPKQKHCTP